MGEEQNSGTTDNQADLGTAGDEGQTGNTNDQNPDTGDNNEANGATGKEPEFKDPNMQKAFTQKMTEMSEMRKTYESAIKKAEALDELSAHDGFRKWYYEQLQKSENPEETQEDRKKVDELTDLDDDLYTKAITDKKSFQEVIDGRATKIAEIKFRPIIDKLYNKLNTMEMDSVINDFAEAKDDSGKPIHGDFYDLDKAGKIEPWIRYLRKTGMDGYTVIDTAYKMAKYPQLKAEAIANAHKVVDEKKAGIGEKGTASTGKRMLPKNTPLLEVARQAAKDMGMEWK